MILKIVLALTSSIFGASGVLSAGNTSGGGGGPVIIQAPSNILIFCERHGRLNDNGLAPQTVSIVKRGAVVNGRQNYDVYLTTPFEKVVASGGIWNGPGDEVLFLNWLGVKFSIGPWQKLSLSGEKETYQSGGGLQLGQRSAVYRCFTNVQTEVPNCLLGEDCCPRHPTSCGGE